MTLFSLNQGRVRSIRNGLPEIKKAPLIGRGSFGAVFASENPSRVYKLTMDKTHVAYLFDGLSPQGQYKPVVFNDDNEVAVGELNDGVEMFLVEMERLYPIRRGTDNGRLARKIINVWDRYKTDDDAFDQACEYFSKELSSFMRSLRWFLQNFGCQPDMHFANFMQRENGTLVFSDPVFDQKLFNSYVRD